MGLAGLSLGRELRALALSHTASVPCSVLRRGTACDQLGPQTRVCRHCALTHSK